MSSPAVHDGILTWKHFPLYSPFVRELTGDWGDSPRKGPVMLSYANQPHQMGLGQHPNLKMDLDMMFSVLVAGDSRHHDAHVTSL